MSKIKNVPKTIFLHIPDNKEVGDFNDLYHSEVSWYTDRISEKDICYELKREENPTK